MNKIYLPSIILFLIGIVITISGSMLKIMHWPGSRIIIPIGMITEICGIIYLIVTLIRNSK